MSLCLLQCGIKGVHHHICMSMSSGLNLSLTRFASSDMERSACLYPGGAQSSPLSLLLPKLCAQNELPRGLAYLWLCRVDNLTLQGRVLLLRSSCGSVSVWFTCLALQLLSLVFVWLAHWLLGGDKLWDSYLHTHFRVRTRK